MLKSLLLSLILCLGVSAQPKAPFLFVDVVNPSLCRLLSPIPCAPGVVVIVSNADATYAAFEIDYTDQVAGAQHTAKATVPVNEYSSAGYFLPITEEITLQAVTAQLLRKQGAPLVFSAGN